METLTIAELDLGNWNGKVYGREEYDSFNIYLNNKKINITIEQKKELDSLHYTPVYYRKEKSVNRSIKGDYVKKDKFYEDEFNAALGMVG